MVRIRIDEGAKDRYRQMLVYPDERTQQIADNELKWAMSVLKRQDRVIWYLRLVRARLDQQLLKANLHNDDLRKKLQLRLVDVQKFFQSDLTTLLTMDRSILRNQLEHYLSLNIHGIETLIWANQTPQTLLGQMKAIEDEWKASRNQYIDMDADEGPELIMEFPDGFAWWNLNRPYCSIEGSAMGHCGNSAARRGTVLSLRHKDPNPKPGKNLWRPVATFILDDQGRLGEMKGRENKKPQPRYHPYIVALLRNDMIRGIKGGGYAPSENFSIHDLDPGERDQLIADKPDLQSISISDIFARTGTLNNPDMKNAIDDINGRCRANILPYDYDLHEIKSEWEGQTRVSKMVLLTHLGNFDQMVREYSDVVPMIDYLDSVRDDIGVFEKHLIGENPSEKLTPELVEDLYQGMSEAGQHALVRISVVRPVRDSSLFGDISLVFQHGNRPELVQAYNKAVQRVNPLSDSIYTEEKIEQRLRTYLGMVAHGIFVDYHSGVMEIEGEYYQTMDVNTYVGLLENLQEYFEGQDAGDDDEYEDFGDDNYLHTVMEKGWTDWDEWSNAEENIVQALSDDDMIVPKSQNSTSRFNKYRLKSYKDAVYGDDNESMLPEHLMDKISKEFERILLGQSNPTGVQDDPNTIPMDLPGGRGDKMFDHYLIDLRRRAGICG